MANVLSFLLSAGVFAGVLLCLTALLLIAERVLVNYGECEVSVNAGERVFISEGGGTLLAALYDSEIFIPSACGSKGSCGFCKVTVRSGGGPVLPTETPYLTRREIRGGLRLACQVKVKEDLVVAMPEEYLNVRLYQATVTETRDLTYDIKEIRLELAEPAEIEFLAGQYVQVQAPGPEGPVFRAYSIASPVSQAHSIELVVRLVPGGIGSTYLHTRQPGDEVILTGPFGDFRLSEDPETELVCVSGGCGMAPTRCLIHSLLARWPERRCWLFFGCRGTQDIFYLENFQELARQHPNFTVVYALSDRLKPGESWDGETGFIHLSVDKYLKPGVRRQAFLCGPPPMIEAAAAVLNEKGLRDGDIFYDKF